MPKNRWCLPRASDMLPPLNWPTASDWLEPRRRRCFRCESVVLRSYRVLVVMGQFTRRLVAFGCIAVRSRASTGAACLTQRSTARASPTSQHRPRSGLQGAPLGGESADLSGDDRTVITPDTHRLDPSDEGIDTLRPSPPGRYQSLIDDSRVPHALFAAGCVTNSTSVQAPLSSSETMRPHSQ